MNKPTGAMFVFPGLLRLALRRNLPLRPEFLHLVRKSIRHGGLNHSLWSFVLRFRYTPFTKRFIYRHANRRSKAAFERLTNHRLATAVMTNRGLASGTLTNHGSASGAIRHCLFKQQGLTLMYDNNKLGYTKRREFCRTAVYL